MASLYEQYLPAWDEIRGQGFHAVAEMAKHFERFDQMEDALGWSRSVVTKWIKRRGGVSPISEMKAQNWLEKQSRQIVDHAPKSTAPSGEMLIVACPPGISEKAKKLLSVLGCEVTDL